LRYEHSPRRQLLEVVEREVGEVLAQHEPDQFRVEQPVAG
jgi:hypothetical protein